MANVLNLGPRRNRNMTINLVRMMIFVWVVDQFMLLAGSISPSVFPYVDTGEESNRQSNRWLGRRRRCTREGDEFPHGTPAPCCLCCFWLHAAVLLPVRVVQGGVEARPAPPRAPEMAAQEVRRARRPRRAAERPV